MATTVNSRRRRIVTFLSAMLVLGIVSVAVAAWVADGSGQGYVASGEVDPIDTVSVTASTDSLLYPSGTADVRLTIKNDNPFNVEVTAIKNPATAAIASGNAACDLDHQVTFADRSGSWLVPANGTLDVELADAAAMGATSADACQNRTFTIQVDLEGASTGAAASTDAS